MQLNSIIRIIIYSFVLLLVTLFEEPRISILLKLVFPDEFSRAFSYSIPFLVVCITVMCAGAEGKELKNWARTSAFSFGVILILSYFNTVMVSISQAQNDRADKITELRNLIGTKQKEFQKPAGIRNCYAPPAGIEGYEDLIAGYRSCIYTARRESEKAEKQAGLLSAEIAVLTADLDSLQKSGTDWTKPATQGATGIFLSLILSIATSIFCLALAKELNDFLLVSGTNENAKLAIWISDGLSVRQIADLLEVSKSTADRKIREFRTIQEFRTVQAKNGIGNTHYAGNTHGKRSVPSVGQQWDTSGTDRDSRGTEPGQPQKPPKCPERDEDRNSSIFGGIFDADFGGFAGSGRMA